VALRVEGELEEGWGGKGDMVVGWDWMGDGEDIWEVRRDFLAEGSGTRDLS